MNFIKRRLCPRFFWSVFAFSGLLVRRWAQDGWSVHTGSTLPPSVSSLSLFSFFNYLYNKALLFASCLSPTPSFFYRCLLKRSSSNRDLILLCLFPSVDLCQRVRAAAPAACQPPSWCLYPLPLHPLRLQRRLGLTTRCQTASQEFCLPTWRRWRYL